MKKVYLLKSDYSGYYKIGVSKNPARRVKQLLTGSSENISILHIYESEIASLIEGALHNAFSHCHVNREWYDLTLENEIGFLELCANTEKNINLVRQNNLFS